MSQAPLKKARALIIEDNEPYRTLLSEVLKNFQETAFDITSASTLSEGTPMVEQQNPDIILLDLGLPDSQGLDTFVQIKNKAGDIPIIVLTGEDSTSLALRALREGAWDYLIKGQGETNDLIKDLQQCLYRVKSDEDERPGTLEQEEFQSDNTEQQESQTEGERASAEEPEYVDQPPLLALKDTQTNSVTMVNAFFVSSIRQSSQEPNAETCIFVAGNNKPITVQDPMQDVNKRVADAYNNVRVGHEI